MIKNDYTRANSGLRICAPSEEVDCGLVEIFTVIKQ